MAGIRLEWAQFGDFDSFDVIRSDTSMANVADADLPSPIATNLKTMYYVDVTVVEGNTYYYKVRAWRDDIGVLSSEILIKAQTGDYFWDNVVALLHFDNNLNDSTGRNWNSDAGSVTYVNSPIATFNNEAVFNACNIKSEHSNDFIFDADFTIEFFITPTDLDQAYSTILSSYNTSWSNPVSFIMLYGTNAPSQYNNYKKKIAMGVFTNAPLIACNSEFSLNQRTHVVFQRKGGLLAVYKAGVLENSITYTATIYFSNTANGISIGVSPWDRVSSYLKAKLDEMRVTKGVARYSENFTPPDKPFLEG